MNQKYGWLNSWATKADANIVALTQTEISWNVDPAARYEVNI